MFKKPFIFLAVITLFVFSIVAVTLALYRKEFFILRNSRGYDASKQIAMFHGAEVKVPAEISQNLLGYNVDFSENPEWTDPEQPDVLGSSSKEKRIEIDLSKQRLYAYEGSKKKMSFDVSTGKWGLTPTGDFRIWIKLRYTLMKGGSQELGTYYYLPNVPFTMYFYKDFGIHGAYWHDNFGHPMSHGCINMRPGEAERLFHWANPPLPEDTNSILASNDNKGTRVVIYGTTPNE